VTGYIGFDATAPSLHVGSLVQIMILRRMQQSGHKPVVLMAAEPPRSATPPARTESRRLLTDAEIDATSRAFARCSSAFSPSATGRPTPLWSIMMTGLGKLEYVPFLRDTGRHFTITGC
jgi:tyrosyl-tRNA synthetase